MPMKAAVFAMLPSKRLHLGVEIAALEQLARLPQRHRHDLAVELAAAGRMRDAADIRRQHVGADRLLRLAGAMISSRSTAFCSWRTLPGQL